MLETTTVDAQTQWAEAIVFALVLPEEYRPRFAEIARVLVAVGELPADERALVLSSIQHAAS